METTVSAEGKQSIVASRKVRVGVFVLHVERPIERLQCGAAIGERLQLRALQIGVTVGVPIVVSLFLVVYFCLFELICHRLSPSLLQRQFAKANWSVEISKSVTSWATPAM